MPATTAEELTRKKCVPCEGGVPTLSETEVDALLAEMPGWSKVEGGQRIRREWQVKNFMAGMDFFRRVAELAESEGHHPDLHLVGYRNVAIEIWTHAIGGLSENDFILAAKIEALPILEKKICKTLAEWSDLGRKWGQLACREVGREGIDDRLQWGVASLLKGPIHAHQNRLGVGSSVAPVSEAVLADHHRGTDRPLGVIVVEGDLGIVEEG